MVSKSSILSYKIVISGLFYPLFEKESVWLHEIVNNNNNNNEQQQQKREYLFQIGFLCLQSDQYYVID